MNPLSENKDRKCPECGILLSSIETFCQSCEYEPIEGDYPPEPYGE